MKNKICMDEEIEELRKLMSREISTYENELVKSMTKKCAEVAFNYFNRNKTQDHVAISETERGCLICGLKFKEE